MIHLVFLLKVESLFWHPFFANGNIGNENIWNCTAATSSWKRERFDSFATTTTTTTMYNPYYYGGSWMRQPRRLLTPPPSSGEDSQIDTAMQEEKKFVPKPVT